MNKLGVTGSDDETVGTHCGPWEYFAQEHVVKELGWFLSLLKLGPVI